MGYASLLSVAGGRNRENACELKSNTFWNFWQAILTMLVIKSVLIGMILSPLIQYVLDIPHKCRATVLDLLLEQKYSYLPTKRIVCKENSLLNQYILVDIPHMHINCVRPPILTCQLKGLFAGRTISWRWLGCGSGARGGR